MAAPAGWVLQPHAVRHWDHGLPQQRRETRQGAADGRTCELADDEALRSSWAKRRVSARSRRSGCDVPYCPVCRRRRRTANPRPTLNSSTSKPRVEMIQSPDSCDPSSSRSPIQPKPATISPAPNKQPAHARSSRTRRRLYPQPLPRISAQMSMHSSTQSSKNGPASGSVSKDGPNSCSISLKH